MTSAGIAAFARTATFAVLAAGAALGLATSAAAPAAHAITGPGQPNGPGRLYGDPAAAASFWRLQTYNDCVVMATADVIGQLTGNEPSEREIIGVAQSIPSTVHRGPIYTLHSGHGAASDDEPALLAHYGIKAEITVNQDIEALERYLAAGRKVIVSVNAELIWSEPVEGKLEDGQPRANHEVVVTGVDTGSGIVHLNDSGTEDGCDEQIPLGLFVKSWATGDDTMTVTG